MARMHLVVTSAWNEDVLDASGAVIDLIHHEQTEDLVPFTAEEELARDAEEAASAIAVEAATVAEAARQSDLEAIRAAAATDPRFAALARVIGIHG